MKQYLWRIVLALALAALAAGCGGQAGGTTAAAGTTTTTTAGTTTTTTTTAPSPIPADTHSGFGVSWTAVWPPDGAEAIYRATRGDEQQDVAARIDYGVEWAGGTWDRLTIGTAVSGQTGMAWYFDRSTPWILRLAGADAFFTNAGGANLERAVFDEPLVLDLNLLPGHVVEARGSLSIAASAETPPFLTLDYALQATSLGRETLTLPAGRIEEAWHIQIMLGDQSGGPGAHLWVHPEHLLVAWEEAGIFNRVELVAPWH